MTHTSASRATAIGRHRFAAIDIVEASAATLGTVLIVAAVAAGQSWLDRHFLPSFFIPRHWYVLIESVARGVIAATGALLVAGRSWLARLLLRAPAMTLAVAVAAALAVPASELSLRLIHQRPTGWLVPDEEPRRHNEPQLGWVLAPARTGRSAIGGRVVEYAVDAAGYRVRRVNEPVDPQRPSLVFAGESVMFGEGLEWAESIPAQVGSILGIQSANLAVHGYSSDQIYMRLVRELPRFDQPVAVVSIFMTELFGRNLDADRPHLGPGLVWQPARRENRLMSLAAMLVPYRRATTVEQGIRVTREVFLGIAELARRRGATPLVIVPQFGFDDDAQPTIRRQILDDIPTVLVQLDPDWRLAWDRHPNARAARVMANAIAVRLRGR